MTKRNSLRLALATVAALLISAAGFADTLELKDGRVLQGKYLGGTQVVVRFEVNGDVQTFPTNTIVALTFTRNSASSPTAAAPPPAAPEPQAAAPAPPPANSYAGSAANGGDVTLPAGQPILVRMIDGVDSSKKSRRRSFSRQFGNRFVRQRGPGRSQGKRCLRSSGRCHQGRYVYRKVRTATGTDSHGN